MRFSFLIILSVWLFCGLSFAEETANSAIVDSVAIDSIKADSVSGKNDSVTQDTIVSKNDTTKTGSVAKADSVKKDSATAKVDSVKKDSAIAKVDSVKKDSVPAKTAQKYLHVLTNPFTADIYVNDSKPDFASRPDYVSPAFIKVPGSSPIVQITLFQREYADTTINVTLSPKDTSYLIVALRPHGDAELTEFQDKELAHRSRRNLGKNLLIASGVPFIVSAVTAYLTYNYIESAKDEKSHVQNSLIRSGSKYEQHVKNYRDDRDKARTSKKVAATALGTGIALMSIGIILSF